MIVAVAVKLYYSSENANRKNDIFILRKTNKNINSLTDYNSVETTFSTIILFEVIVMRFLQISFMISGISIMQFRMADSFVVTAEESFKPFTSKSFQHNLIIFGLTDVLIALKYFVEITEINFIEVIECY